ncbi:delta-1-pyrroline-5-carboxylate dehydrogenase [Elysia marginata]|uniref:Multifunctional fusion protein n=1 Tax=Elysia marginata TaxID=1093978 RepID=A0AAV4GH53_9GAST|nr:delta-1-pyrroline-5-carboxylate dehydrogenase [Elysia marginata]
MANTISAVPIADNEPPKSYAPNTEERDEVLEQYRDYYNNYLEVPLHIGGEDITTSNMASIVPPHDHKHEVGRYHLATKKHIEQAIAVAMKAREKWVALSWEQRMSIFLKMADLLSGPYRAKIVASTMLCQSKTVHQAEIDAACEFIDFLRFNVDFATQIYSEQPISSKGIWNRLEYRPLEGFIYAATPFNFTAIAANLCTSVAMMGNVVVWKPSESQMYSAKIIMDVFRESGLPDGVVNMVSGNPEMITDTVLNSPDFAGIHYTGSTEVFKGIWKKIGQQIQCYKTYPKIVGETGGKDFIVAHHSANSQEVATAISRGAFEFQGQKCSAASRVYLPVSNADEIIELLKKDIQSFKIGSPEDMGNFITAVIHERAFDRLANYIDRAKQSSDAEVIIGGKYNKSKGYFVEPTVILTTNPNYETMETELFGPVVTIYKYPQENWEDLLDLVDKTSPYALTGAVFSKDRYAIDEASKKLENAAGNFYINDKPTGAVVGQQPFGGARASGTNDKAGSPMNLLRWVSTRLIKETFVPPKNYRYTFLDGE